MRRASYTYTDYKSAYRRTDVVYLIVFNMVCGQLSEAGAPRQFLRPPGGLNFASDVMGTATAFVRSKS
jgi:hypothetical protein